MTQFMKLVKNANLGFRESARSLNALCKLLRLDSRPDQIAHAIAAMPQDTQQQYRTALTHLQNTFPGLLGQGILGAQLVGAFQAREARIPSQYLTRQITQTQGSGYAWEVKPTFEDRPTALVVKPMIRYRAKPNDPHSHSPSAQELSAWKARIQGAWQAKFLIKRSSKDVVFDINFVPWDAPAGQGAHEIDVVNIPVEEAQQNKLVQQGVMPQGSTLQTRNWNVKGQAKQLTLGGNSPGTPHLGQRGAQDPQAIVHEFGHAIGCPDEYLVTAHNLHYGGHSSVYNLKPFSTDSIMNDTRKAKIYARHFAVIVDLLKQWKTTQEGPSPQIVIVNPNA